MWCLPLLGKTTSYTLTEINFKNPEIPFANGAN
jgi:hypothetical protein